MMGELLNANYIINNEIQTIKSKFSDKPLYGIKVEVYRTIYLK